MALNIGKSRHSAFMGPKSLNRFHRKLNAVLNYVRGTTPHTRVVFDKITWVVWANTPNDTFCVSFLYSSPRVRSGPMGLKMRRSAQGRAFEGPIDAVLNVGVIPKKNLKCLDVNKTFKLGRQKFKSLQVEPER